jgi:membrane-associated PAP2 superfamily phosphatase
VRGNSGIWRTLGLLLAVLVCFGFSDWDLWFQDQLFDASSGAWLVDSAAWLPRLVFYRLPKIALGAWALWLAARALRWLPEPTSPSFLMGSRDAAFLLSALVAVPLLVGAGKQVTGVHCPAQLQRYGGKEPVHNWFGASSPADESVPRGRCFPAAHASGGFAVMGLAFVGRRRLRRVGLNLGLGLGWVMGGYQMLRGVHFLSHTIVSMLFSWLVLLSLARLFGFDNAEGEDPRWLGGEAPSARSVHPRFTVGGSIF